MLCLAMVGLFRCSNLGMLMVLLEPSVSQMAYIQCRRDCTNGHCILPVSSVSDRLDKPEETGDIPCWKADRLDGVSGQHPANAAECWPNIRQETDRI
jgi:hypothetical protein